MKTDDTIDQVRIRVLPDGRVSRRDAATFLGHSEKTLANWALKNYGPIGTRVGGKIFYKYDDLKVFASVEAA